MKINEIPVEQLIASMTAEQKNAIIATLNKTEDEQKKAIDAVILENEALKKKFDDLTNEFKEVQKAFSERKLPNEDPPKDDFGFKTFGHFLKAVHQANTGKGTPDNLLAHQKSFTERRLKAAGDGMQVWDDSEGGFAIPEQFVPGLLAYDPNLLNLAGRATQFQMSSPIAHISTIVDTSHATYVYGAILAYFKSEESELTASKPTFGEITLTANKLTTIAYVTDEMMTFTSSAIESLIAPKFQNAIQWKIDQKIISGTGAGEPRGLLNSACKVSYTRDTASHLMGVDIAGMWARMPMNLRANAVWIINPSAVPDLMSANIVIGTGGQLIYLPPQGVSTAPYGTIYGKPVLETEHCSALGTAGDFMFVNMKEYIFGQVASASGSGMVASIHLKFDYAQTAFRIILYVDGQCWWSSYLTLADGSTTQSPIVVLT